MANLIPIETTIEIIGFGENLGEVGCFRDLRGEPIKPYTRADSRPYIDFKITVKQGETVISAGSTLDLNCRQMDQLRDDIAKTQRILLNLEGEQDG